MRFTHIYVEERAAGYPLTGRILEKIPDANVITITHYKDVFDRKRQDAAMQKEHQTLIIAVRDGNRIFRGAPVCQSFGNANFYYASSMMNCPFDCGYCYLKGMYPSSHMVVFVNLDDYRRDVEEKLKEGPVYVCASYDTDLLAMDGLTGHAGFWKDMALSHQELLVELRTKAAVEIKENISNIIYAFTMSPEEVVMRYEHNTAPVKARIRSAAGALRAGAKVRMCFDPVIKIPDWKEAYKRLIDEVVSAIDPGRLTDVSVGTFRISSDYLARMRKAYPGSEIAWYPYVIKEGVAQYGPELDREMQEYVCGLLGEHIGREKIFTWN
ncbi:MAG: radical SAM protein [Lachnospiraceae bacterium]|nr:radical SAM protein [Lachnospiraceae bacterium]